MPALMNLPMHDGSRQFGSLPQKVLWHAARDHVALLPGAALTKFLCDDVTEAWIDFSYEGHAFTINDQFGEYLFFVDGPACPDDVLISVLEHFDRLLR